MAVTRYIHSQWKMYFSTIVIQDAKQPQAQPGMHSSDTKRSEMLFQFFTILL